jgi:hypothetical protein
MGDRPRDALGPTTVGACVALDSGEDLVEPPGPAAVLLDVGEAIAHGMPSVEHVGVVEQRFEQDSRGSGRAVVIDARPCEPIEDPHETAADAREVARVDADPLVEEGPQHVVLCLGVLVAWPSDGVRSHVKIMTYR